MGYSAEANSIYATGSGLNERAVLSWEEVVPWNNYEYVILRKNDSGTFDSVGVSLSSTYIDNGLTNNKEYCYIIKSRGNYGSTAIPQTLLNHSQEICIIPIDTDPPCIPNIEVTNGCQEDAPIIEEFDYNYLNWNFETDNCNEDEPLGFHIYYTRHPSGSMELVGTITQNNTQWDWTHSPLDELNGCYAVSAFDSLGNESALSTIVCVENCPNYELPNTFTPNGDGQNDIFKPYPYRFVERVEFIVYNQWGNKVFETKDPDLNWDGKNLRGVNLKPGVYFYTCKVFETGLIEVKERDGILKGYIELIK